MSKPELTKQREARERGEILAKLKAQTHDIWLFAKRLTVTMFGLSILALGVTAGVYAHTKNIGLWQYPLFVSAACAITNGVAIMFYALVKVK